MKYKLMFLWLLTVFVLIKAATAYTIVGDSVMIDDPQVYLSATPHTLTENGWVAFNFTSKIYTGDANVVLGVDTEQMTPKKVMRWNFAQDRWVSFDKDWSSVYRNLDDKNKWWYLQDVPIVAGQDYRIAVKFDIAHNLTGKYDFGIYPSSYGGDILGANANGHLYYLDPWFNSSWVYCKDWNITESDGIQRNNMVVQHNLTGLTLFNNATEIRIINGSCLGGGNEIEYSLVKTDDTAWATVQYWVNISASDTIKYAVYYGASAVPNPLPYDSPPIMFNVNFPDGTNTTGDVNRTAPYIFDINTHGDYDNYNGYSDYFTGQGTTYSVYVHWYIHKNFLYYTDSDYADIDVVNVQTGHRMNTGTWRSYVGVFIPRITNSISGINFDDGYVLNPIHYTGSSYTIQQYLNTVYQYGDAVTSSGDTTNFIHTNSTYWSNGSVSMSTNTSSSNTHYNSTIPATDFNGISINARSGYAEAHWMKMTTGSLYGVELSEYDLTLSDLSPEYQAGTYFSPSELNASMIETTAIVEYGWLINNISGTNNTYNLTLNFNESCFDATVNPSFFWINGSDNQTINWTFDQYNNCSTGTFSGSTYIYIDGQFLDEIPINLNVTEDINTYIPTSFSMTINQGSLDTTYLNTSNSNSDTNSTFTFTDNFDVFCFSKTYLPSTFDLDGVENEQWGFMAGVNPLCPNTTYYGNISVYDDGFLDTIIEGTILVTNITSPITPISAAGMNCTYSDDPYLRKTIDWACLLNTSSDWYCYGSIYWNNNPNDLVSISPDSEEFEDIGLLDYQLVSGRILNMQFKRTDLYSDNMYNFTVECVSDITNQTASFSTTIINSESGVCDIRCVHRINIAPQYLSVAVIIVNEYISCASSQGNVIIHFISDESSEEPHFWLYRVIDEKL